MKNNIVCENIYMNLTEFERMLELIRIINSKTVEQPEKATVELLTLIASSEYHS